jgi:endoglucanase
MRILLAAFFTGSVLLGSAPAQTGEMFPGLDDGKAGSGPPPFANLHGVNLGNFLEAPKEGAWINGRLIEENDFALIHNAGFTLIRVPISWAAHVGPAPDYTIDPAFFSRIDWVVVQAEKNGLIAILDNHNDDKLMKDPDTNAARFVATWKQIAQHYKEAPPSVWFELLNEPNGKLDAAAWNNLIALTLPNIRASNPTRTIVVGPTHWNSIGALEKLKLPDRDQNLLVTIHFYDPMTFTHQGASWIQGSDKWLGNTWGTDAEKKAVTDSFDQAAAWGLEHKRPLYLGEFGAFSKGDMDSRVRWTAFVARAAEAHDFPWTYWEFCAGFGVYDPQAHTWRQPLLDALLPK